MSAPESAMNAIMGERRRQLEVLEFTPGHDDAYTDGELAIAAAAYALATRDNYLTTAQIIWPWPVGTFKAGSSMRRRNLVKAGALILAEIERLDREQMVRSGLESANG
jgi:hypothetical protein